MPEYIEREIATNAAVDYVWGARNFSTLEIAKVINDIPAADVAPVVHGKWISYLDGEHLMPERYYECSKCGDRGYKFRGNYCSNCGAKMDLP